MLRALFAALPLLLASHAWALSCAQPRPIWWPNGESVSAKPFIVLENERLETAWLEGPKASRVEVDIVQAGRYQRLTPKAPLTVGATYTLKGVGKYRFAKGPWRQKDYGAKQTPVRWTVRSDASPAPRWTGDIRVGKAAARHGVWGPTSSQTLHLSWKSDAPAIAEVLLNRGKQAVTLYLPVTPEKPLTFGQGLCDGEVNLIGEGDWTARVTLIGPSGQRSKARRVTFPSPVAQGAELR